MGLPLIMSPTTPDKLEVISVASNLGIDPDLAFAKIFRFWAMIHESKDGVLQGIDKEQVDKVIGFRGFCDCLISVGWLAEDLCGVLYVPDFDSYLSEKAVLGKLRQLGIKPKDAVEEIPTELQTAEFQAAWKKWKKYRAESKKRLTPSTARMQLEQCAEMGPEKAVASIEQSILRGWQGLFHPKGIEIKAKLPLAEMMEIARQQTMREKAAAVPPPPNWRKGANRG